MSARPRQNGPAQAKALQFKLVLLGNSLTCFLSQFTRIVHVNDNSMY